MPNIFEKMKILYIQNRIGITQLEKAVEKSWITEEQKQQIINGN